MELSKKIEEEFKERVIDESMKNIDYETSWAILNGLVISYFKAKGKLNKKLEEELKEGIRRVILSLPKYELGYGKDYKLNVEDKAYFALCPSELVKGLSYNKINEKTVMEIAEKVVQISAENGVKEDTKMRIADKGVSKASMSEFEEVSKTMVLMSDSILKTRGEDGLKTALVYHNQLAEKAVKDEIDFHVSNANYIVTFYSGILHHLKEEEGGITSIAS